MKKPKMLVTIIELRTCVTRRPWKGKDGYGDGCFEILVFPITIQFQSVSLLLLLTDIYSATSRRRLATQGAMDDERVTIVEDGLLGK